MDLLANSEGLRSFCMPGVDVDFAELAATGEYPLGTDFYYVILVALFLTCVRYSLEWTIFSHLGKKWVKFAEVKDISPPPLVIKAFESNPSLTTVTCQELTSATQMSAAKIREYYYILRTRRANSRLMLKWTEGCWRTLSYTVLFVAQLVICLRQPWMYDTRLCWENWPVQELHSAVRFFYIFMELPFYVHLLFCSVFDIKRKDIVEMTIHHFATIGLFTFSYMVGFTRIGMLVVLCHDLSDALMEPAKLFQYVKLTRISDALFVLFAVSFYILRLYVFPFKVVTSVMYEYGGPTSKSYILLLVLLYLLIILHIFWAYMIAKLAIRLLSGKAVKDKRESDSSDVSDVDNHDKTN